MEALNLLFIRIKRLLGKLLPRQIQQAYARHTSQRSKISVINYFNAQYPKRVLLSYVDGPFLGSELDSHSNRREALVIAECFHKMGYCVDVVPYNFQSAIDYSPYSCVFGLGDPVERSFDQDVPNLMRIHYATGCHVQFQNTATLRRAQDVHKNKGVWLLDSCRKVPWTWSAQTTLADAMLVIGNQLVMNSYRLYYQGPIFPQITSYYAALPLDVLEGKNFSEAKKHFLYFGSTGAIHKGLDLLLEVFSENPDKILHIAAPLEGETAFVKAFAEELACPNIILHGFLDVRSEAFRHLMRECAFAVLPSCSEGISTSLLNVMCNGLVPVLTPECGYDPMPYSVPIEKADILSVKNAVDFCSSLLETEIRKRSLQCLQETRERYSIEAFRAQMEANLLHVLSVQKENC